MKPYAQDWVVINPSHKCKGYIGPVEYSEELNRYFYKGQVYDELSARHNAIIGIGAQLQTIIQNNNQR